MPQCIKKVGGCKTVVDSTGLRIDELIGNVATQEDTLSVARVTAKAGTSEPWLTLQYDEWMCVLKGRMILMQPEATNAEPIIVAANETVLIHAGTRFKPTFPDDCEYIPVCLPAFKPERCAREDTNKEGEDIAANLQKLHGKKQAPRSRCWEGCFSFMRSRPKREAKPEVLYHMLSESDWEAAKKSGKAYYPSTFEVDDFLTHATGVPSRLVDTANHYYTDAPGKWICLEFTRTALKDAGIYVRDEHATPVGDKATSQALMSEWVCPHIIGGIPVDVPRKVYDMVRDEKGERFLGIADLVMN